MTVKELVELLQGCPNQNLRVVVDGYEGGYHDLESKHIGLIELELNVNSEWYYGPHESVSKGNKADETALRLGKSPSSAPLYEMVKSL